MTGKIIVVSDAFKKKFPSSNTISYSELINLNPNSSIPFDKLSDIYIGQGLSDVELDILYSIVGEKSSMGAQIRCHPDKPPIRAASEETHKINSRNILITKPTRVDDENFRYELIIDSACDILQDHIAGAHVSGMLIIEAARQSTIATFESVIRNSVENSSFALSLESVQITFKNLLIPFSSKIECNLSIKRRNGDIWLKGVCISTFYQAGEQCAVISISFTAINSSLLTSLELGRIKNIEKKILTND